MLGASRGGSVSPRLDASLSVTLLRHTYRHGWVEYMTLRPRNQFAPVCNLEVYKHLFDEDRGTYQLLIATEVVKNPDDWADFWIGEVTADHFIIMDNGLIEAGAAADIELIRAACVAVAPSCVV